jgi:carbonic anhydrase
MTNPTRLLEAIVAANHSAIAGDKSSGLHTSEYADSLPLVVLTCIDPRLNCFFPGIMAVREDQFIWLRNAGNSITSSLSSTVRSIALACAVKGGREIAVIGHTDCQIGKANVMDIINRFQALGIPRQQLPDNLMEYFGLFGSERQNVIKAVDFLQKSPIIGRQIKVHGLLVDTASGRLEWVVNGYNMDPAKIQMDVAPSAISGNLMTGLMGNIGEAVPISAVAAPTINTPIPTSNAAIGTPKPATPTMPVPQKPVQPTPPTLAGAAVKLVEEIYQGSDFPSNLSPTAKYLLSKVKEGMQQKIPMAPPVKSKPRRDK